MTHLFIRSECEEAAVRGALDDAEPLYRDAPEAEEREWSITTIKNFMKEALPTTPEKARELVAELIMETLTSVGKSFSETPRTSTEIDIYADAMANMFCAYINTYKMD